MTDPNAPQQPEQPATPAYPAANSYSPAGGQPGYTPAPPSGKKTFGILSLVFGIVAIVLSWILPIIWIVLGILGVVFGFMSRRREQTGGLAIAGIVLSFIGIAACIVSMVIGAIAAAQLYQQLQGLAG